MVAMMGVVGRCRRRAAVVALCAYLASPVVSATATYFMLHSQPLAAACRCPHSDGQTCPMHQTGQDKECVFRSAYDHHHALVTTLLGPTGLLPSVAYAEVPAGMGVTLLHQAPACLDNVRVPNAPPPRA
jgi:hypothetical protein